MIYFTSDQHFGHGNIIQHCRRPFADAPEMDAELIRLWNAKVGREDTVYVLGDLFFPSAYDHESVLKKLKGKKHLILGNHDKNWIKKVDLSKYFESVQPTLTIESGYGALYLCHCPLLTFKGNYMIYGHIHNNKNDEHWPVLKTMDNALNASVEVNGYAPVTFEELAAHNELFRMDRASDGGGVITVRAGAEM
ncbi:metallophosphatase [Clostridia bacterium]|nr:metallophosphatase [Clostridia bacterium]